MCIKYNMLLKFIYFLLLFSFYKIANAHDFDKHNVFSINKQNTSKSIVLIDSNTTKLDLNKDSIINTAPDVGLLNIDVIKGSSQKKAVFGNKLATQNTHIYLNDDIKTSNLLVQASDNFDTTLTITHPNQYIVIQNSKKSFNLLNVRGSKDHKATLNINGILKLNAEHKGDDHRITTINGGDKDAIENSIINVNGIFYVEPENFKNDPVNFHKRNHSQFKDLTLNLNANSRYYSASFTLVNSNAFFKRKSSLFVSSLNLWGKSSFYGQGGNGYSYYFTIADDSKMEMSSGSFMAESPTHVSKVFGLLDIKSNAHVGVNSTLNIEKDGVVITDKVHDTHDPKNYEDLNLFYKGNIIKLKADGHLALREDTSLNYLRDYVESDYYGIIAIDNIGFLDTNGYSVEKATAIAEKFNLNSTTQEYNIYDTHLITLQGFTDNVDITKPIIAKSASITLGLKDFTKDYQYDFYKDVDQGGSINNKLIADIGGITIQNGSWNLKDVELRDNSIFDVMGGETTIHNLKFANNSSFSVYDGLVKIPNKNSITFENKDQKDNLKIIGGHVIGDYYNFVQGTEQSNDLKLKNFINKDSIDGHLTLDKGQEYYTLEELRILNKNTDLLVNILGKIKDLDPNNPDPNYFPIRNQSILDNSIGGMIWNYIDETAEPENTRTDFIVGKNVLGGGAQKLGIKKVILQDHKLVVGDKKGAKSILEVAEDIVRVNNGKEHDIVIDYDSKLTLYHFANPYNSNNYTVDSSIVGGEHKGLLEVKGNYTVTKNIGDAKGHLNLSIFKGNLIANKDIDIDKLEVLGSLNLKGSLSTKERAIFYFGDSNIKEIKSIENGFYIDADLKQIQDQDKKKQYTEALVNSNKDGYISLNVETLTTNKNKDAYFDISGSLDNDIKSLLHIQNIEDGHNGVNTFFVDNLGNLSLGNLHKDNIKEIHKDVEKHMQSQYKIDNWNASNIVAISKFNNGSKLNLAQNNLHLGSKNSSIKGLYVGKNSLLITDFTDVKEHESLINGYNSSHKFEDGASIYIHGVKNKNYKKYILISDTEDKSAGIKNYDKDTKEGVHIISSNRLIDFFIKQEEKDLVLIPKYNSNNQILDHVDSKIANMIINNENNKLIESLLDNANGLTDKDVAIKIEAAAKASLISNAYSDVIYNARKSMSLVSDRFNNTMSFLKLDIADRFYNLWTNTMYEHSKVHGLESSTFNYGLKSNLKGIVIGLDTTKDNFTKGAYISYAQIDTHNTDDFLHVKKDSNNLGLAYYLNYDLYNYSLGAIFSYHTQANDVEHDIRIDKLNGSFEANSINARLNLSCKYNFDNFALDTYAIMDINYLMAKDLSLKMQDIEVVKNYAENKLFSSITLGTNILYKTIFFNKDINVEHKLAIEKNIGNTNIAQTMSFTGSEHYAKLESKVLDDMRYTVGTSLYYHENKHVYKFTVSDTFSKNVNNIDIMFNYSYAF